MKKLLFLDLEETLIDDWLSRNILDEQTSKIVNQIIIPNNFKEAKIFSMAIWEEVEEREFNSFFKEELEKVLQISLSTEKILPIFNQVLKSNNIKGEIKDFTDIFCFNSKKQLFEEWIRLLDVRDVEIFLVDDTIDDGEVFFKKENKRIIFVNPLNLI